MGSDRAMVGKRYPAATVTLAPARGAAFAAATDDVPSADVDAGLLPPMAVVLASIPHGVMQVVADDALIGDMARLARLVHAEEEIAWHAPLRPDVPWTVTPTLEAVAPCAAGEALTVRTDVATRGELLAVATSRLIIRERPAGGRPASKPDDSAPAARSTPASSRLPALGPAGANGGWRTRWDVAMDQAQRYAEASGDHNPIHLDPIWARRTGLRGCILHGLCTMAFAARAVLRAADRDGGHLQRLRLRFVRPVYLGDALICAGTPPAPAQAPTSRFVLLNGTGHLVGADGEADLRA